MAPKLTMFLAWQLSAASFAQSLDPTFGTNGTVQHDNGGSERLFAAAIQPDGRIVACGLRDSSGIGHLLVCRFQSDGTFDNSFGGGGYVMLPTGTQSSDASMILVQPDGRILVAGKTTETDGYTQFMVRRLLSNGTVDSGFGTDGVWTHSVGPLGGYITDLAMDDFGRIIVAGMIIPANALGAFAVTRLDSNGNLDSSFGNNGFFLRDESTQAITNYFSDMELLPDGRILLAGNVGDLSTGPSWNTDVLCIRLQADGQLDGNFGTGGERVIDLQGLQDGTNRMRILANGELELFGTSGNNTTINLVNRCRLTADGEVLSTDFISVSGWAPMQQTKQITGIEPGPGEVMAYIGTVPNGGTADGFLGFLEPVSLNGLPYQVGYNTTVDAGDWTTFGSGVFDATGRLLLVGLTTNPEWIGQFPSACGVFTDLYMARFNMPLSTGVSTVSAPEMDVWPIPTTDLLNVGCPECHVDRMRLVDSSGREVWSQRRRTTGTTVIDLRTFSAGLYVLIAESGSTTTTHRVMVDH